MKSDTKVRRALVKPLRRRRQRVADHKALSRALERLDDRALGEDVLYEISDLVAIARRNRSAASWKDPDRAREQVALARALYAARRISRQQYVFYAVSPVEVVHEGRWMNGDFDAQLRDIKEAMHAIEKEHGLSSDEYWMVGQGPQDYERLKSRYDAIYEGAFVDALREFGLTDLAALRESRPDEFRRLRERGRRSVFCKDDLIAALKDVVVRYEEDARQAAAAHVYSAAITLLAAGLEGLLLLRCLQSKVKTQRIANSLPRHQRPRIADDPTRWTFEALINTCLAAGWLPPVSTSIAQYNPAGLAHILRLMRNYVHPGRHARERPWSEAEEEDFKDAEAIYVTLLSQVVGRPRRARVGAQQPIPGDAPAPRRHP